MASLNLLFVHEVSYEKKPIFEMHEFPEHLAARGHKVTFLQFDEGFKFWQGNRQPRNKTIAGRVLPESKLKLVTPHQFGIPGVDRLWATITVWPTLESLLKNEKFDAIVLYAVPTYGHQVIQLAKKYGVPVIFRALDVSHLIRKSPLSPLIKSAEKYVYQQSDVLSANNPAMARYCSTLGNRVKGTFTNLPPLDVSHFTPQPRDERLAASLGLAPTDLVITYMGSFFYFSGLDTVIREFAKVAIANPLLKLFLIGGGEQDTQLKSLVEEHNLDGRVIFTGFIPYADLPRYLQLSTVAINPMLSRAVSNTAFPHKVLQYMAAEIPVVSTRLAGIFETFGANGGVTWVDGPAAVLTEAIALAGDGPRRMAYVQQQNAAVTRLLSVDRAIEEFEDLLDKTLEVLK
jgi:glycosyltransferase involved in cell wall biosynthesis